MGYKLLIIFLFIQVVVYGQMDSLVLHKPRKALELAEKALSKPEYLSVRDKLKWSLIAQESCLNLANYQKATEIFEDAKYWNIHGADTIIILEMWRHSARTDAIQNRLESAFDKYTRLFNHYERTGNREKLALIKVNMAEYYRIVQKYEPGKQLLLEVLKEKKTLDSSTVANALHRLAAIEVQVGNWEEGIKLSHQSLKYSEPIGQLQHMASSYVELGFIYHNQKNPLSKKYYRQALKIWNNIEHFHYEAHTLNNLARHYIQVEDYKEAENTLEKAKSIAIEKNIESVQFDVLNILAKVYSLLGKHREAYLLRDSAAEMQIQVLYKQYNRDINELSQAYSTDLAHRKLREMEKEKELVQAKAQKQVQEKKWLRAGIGVMGGVSILIFIFWIRIRNRNTKIKSQKDIIEQQNFRLNQSNDEKDVLLQEVHHRVKNNLQLILALLEFQDDQVKNEDTRILIENIKMRISAIAIVHNQLYDQHDIGEIMVNQYISELVHQSVSAFIGKKPIDLKINMDEVKLSLSQSIALGMITNELIINARKYAFPHTEFPELNISLKCTESNCEFILGDNGPGVKDQEYNGLGMKLIELFSKQLKGEYQFISKNGLIFRLKFPLSEASTGITSRRG